MFGHWFEILVVVVLGLIFFGPKRVIEMGSQLGKMVRELRESTRDINFSSLLSTDEPQKHVTYSNTTSRSSAHTPDATPTANASSNGEERIVEGAVEHTEDITN